MQNLVRVRGIQERVARGGVARAQMVQQSAIAAEREVWTALSNAGGRMHDVSVGAAMHVAQQHLQSGMALARLRGAAKDASAQQLAGELHHWSGTAQRLEAVERLAERADERDAFEAQQAAASELDDLTIARFLMARAS
jgi:flagellar biosynthesis chaperone FliJ